MFQLRNMYISHLSYAYFDTLHGYESRRIFDRLFTFDIVPILLDKSNEKIIILPNVVQSYFHTFFEIFNMTLELQFQMLQ